MVNPLEMMDTVELRRRRKRGAQGLGGARDQMEAYLDVTGFLRRGQIIWLDFYS